MLLNSPIAARCASGLTPSTMRSASIAIRPYMILPSNIMNPFAIQLLTLGLLKSPLVTPHTNTHWGTLAFPTITHGLSCNTTKSALPIRPPGFMLHDAITNQSGSYSLEGELEELEEMNPVWVVWVVWIVCPARRVRSSP